MDFSNCNLCFPKLRVRPSYGDAMRYHAEFCGNNGGSDDIDSACHHAEEFQKFICTGMIDVSVDWGINNSSHFTTLSKFISESIHKAVKNEPQGHIENPSVELRVHGIGRRPAMMLLASSKGEFSLGSVSDEHYVEELGVSWKHSKSTMVDDDMNYLEYVVTLTIGYAQNNILQRTLHVVPPPIGALKFRLEDIVWAPKLFQEDEVNSKAMVQSIFKEFFNNRQHQNCFEMDKSHRRRRGFGLELETVQLPLNNVDHDAGCYTQQDYLELLVERARQWHLSEVEMYDKNDTTETIEAINTMWDQFLLWTVSHDHYVENAAPPSRIDLYNRIKAHLIDVNQNTTLLGSENEDLNCVLGSLILGGKVQIPSELLSTASCKNVSRSQCFPEYKSPLPPHELYHEFPPPPEGRDISDGYIRLFLNGLLINPLVASRAVTVPLVSYLGQSATSIHVHVNITNVNAWPRQSLDGLNDVERTKSLLCVVLSWIHFDRVIQNYFCMPNVWRDRSFAPMFPTGPEFVWSESSWNQGDSRPAINDDWSVQEIKLYNIPAWFDHVYSSYCCETFNEEKKGSTSLFDTIFDHDIMQNTMSRWLSLNLLPIKTYGTIEFRRMHATLNADFISAWTWFCVGFVEKFSSPSLFDTFLHPFLTGSSTSKVGLERLADAQNNSTIEDLFEYMCDKDDPAVPISIFQTLMRDSNPGKGFM